MEARELVGFFRNGRADVFVVVLALSALITPDAVTTIIAATTVQLIFELVVFFRRGFNPDLKVCCILFPCDEEFPL